ncbi:membrane-bound lytic murein transglycosylase D [Pseudomonas asturiensis]|uniref:Membrane-bound lytic murein transglycosylase D n=1 Tax=Pseudomonas asturiensis TaxID=1190415 RepID=A0A1M7LLR2_9PSED|nr:transglycosylase SLT domain-containing protein [Pseudomonas asturiensis]SHM79084.1 membrane-bound lytic murein transglycosylase D [Pseudomonas asturiensis]
MPAVDPHLTSRHSLARSIRIAALALGSLCAGCQSVDYAQPRAERTPRLIAGLNYSPDVYPSSGTSLEVPDDLPVYNGEDVWQRVAQRSTLVKGKDINERIARQRDWLLSNRGFLKGASERAAPYLHFIVERLDERRMPMELALLPMIESAYNPMANSSAAAAGLWQFIPSTGRDFNLHQSATYDARRDVVASSKAAMDYLTRLHDEFDNDWLLALAAYNCGEGTVGRAVEANRRRGLPTDYWSLSLPRETQDYVPRLLALSLLVRNPEAYGVKLTPVANTAYFDVVELNHAVDIPRLAATAGVDEGQLLRLNSAFLRKKTPDGPGRLLVPKTQKQLLTASLARMRGEPSWVAPAPVSEPASAPAPVAPPVMPQRVAERGPVPKVVKSVPVVMERPTPTPTPSVVPEPAPQRPMPETVADRSSPVSPPPVAVERTPQPSPPPVVENRERRTQPEVLRAGPRVVVLASDPRQ